MFAIGPKHKIETLSQRVDEVLGYPRFGVNPMTGEVLLPAEGQPIHEAPGVTLTYASIVESSDATSAAYPLVGAAYDVVMRLLAEQDDLLGIVTGPLPADW